MSEKKFLRIKSLNQEDITALFEAICKNIIDKDPEWVKKEILEFENVNEEPILQDIIDLIAQYDIEHEFSLELNYVDHVVVENKEEATISTASEHRRVMNEEKSMINRSDQHMTDENVRRIDPGSIPNFS